MKKKGICKRLQKSGSISEGLKINDQLEFDVMIINNGENIRISNIVEYPGYAHLKLKQPSKEKKRRQCPEIYGFKRYLYIPGHFYERIF